MSTETATEWSVRTWKERHVKGYFPTSVQHCNWLVYEKPFKWFDEYCKPEPTDVALEIGAGFGEWMIPIAPMVALVYGFDITPELVDMAESKFVEHNVRNAYMATGDGTTIPYRDGWFSLVYCISVFQHLPREMVRGYIRETDRVLRPGGRTVLHFRNADNVGQFPTPAKDIKANHTGDFSCGWTAAQVLEAGKAVWDDCEVVDIGLHLLLLARKADA